MRSSNNREHLGEKTAGSVITFHVTAHNSFLFFGGFPESKKSIFLCVFLCVCLKLSQVNDLIWRACVWRMSQPGLVTCVCRWKCCAAGEERPAGPELETWWESSELTTRCCTGGRRICSTCPELRKSDRHTAAADRHTQRHTERQLQRPRWGHTHTFHPFFVHESKIIVHEWMWTCVEVFQGLKWDELSRLCLVFLSYSVFVFFKSNSCRIFLRLLSDINPVMHVCYSWQDL